MRDVIRCEQSLRELNLTWRMIESAAKMNCPVEARAILPTMAATREGFNRLEQELVASLVNEKVVTVLDEIGTKAQYVIDIVVRHLYERTADVGFLATDTELCAFVAGLSDNQPAIRQRLRAYRSKYTVYDEIILLDAAGNVLVQIDETTPLEGSVDPLIAQTLASDSYVETFRASDLRPARKQALIYSRRMLHPDTGVIVGVLCLCFNFEQEMAGIFQSHRDPAGRSNMMLLDGENRVIESSDALWVPLGALVPVDAAFTGGGSNTLASLDPGIAEGLLSHAQSFSPPLYEIMTAAETIQRVVWNGQVMTAGQRGELMKLKTSLDQISETGARSNELFSKSIGDLYETVLASRLRDSEFVSHLLVDLLDRNLYERSDDCRWWALTPELRAALAESERDVEVIERISRILEYINHLYTVYTRIVVYDASGCIVASTHPGRDGSTVVGGIGIVFDMGCTASSGYREFKVSDGYREDMLAVVFDSFGAVRERLASGHKSDMMLESDLTDKGGREFATFFIDGTLFALPAEHVLEALAASKISSIPRSERKARIGILGLQREGESNGSVWV